MDWSWHLFLGLHYFLSLLGFTISYPSWALSKDVNYICLRARGQCPLLIWSSLNTFRSTCPYWTAGRLTTGCRSVRLQVCHPWHVLQTSLVLRRRGLAWGRCIFTSTVPHQFQNLVVGQKPAPLRFTHGWFYTELVASHVWRVQTANRLFSLRRSYSFGLRFNTALWNRAESGLKWNIYITVPSELAYMDSWS